jgi:hypothetical protein
LPASPNVATEAVGEDDADALTGGPPLWDAHHRRDFRHAAGGLVEGDLDFFKSR